MYILLLVELLFKVFGVQLDMKLFMKINETLLFWGGRSILPIAAGQVDRDFG
jgi:hypothetical protein